MKRHEELVAELEAIQIDAKARRKFMESPWANHLWVMHESGIWSRGNPSKVPYQVASSAEIVKSDHTNNIAYWQHYGIDWFDAPFLGFDATTRCADHLINKGWGQ